jgi:predicted ATPase
MLSGIRLGQFKAFEKLSIPLKPITVFLGPNNSGKSAIISAIRLLAQTAQSFDFSVALLLNGSMGDFGNYRDIVHGNGSRRNIEIEISFLTSLTSSKRDHLDSDEVILSLTYTYDQQRRKVILLQSTVCHNGKALLTTSYLKEQNKHVVSVVAGKAIENPETHPLARNLHFNHFWPQPFSFRSSDEALAQIPKDLEDTVQLAYGCGAAAFRGLRRAEYVGAMRVQPSRTYPYSGEDREYVGRSGEYAISILAQDRFQNRQVSRGLVPKVAAWLSEVAIADRVHLRSFSDRYYEFRLRHPRTREYENLSDVGLGVSQVIPILVGGYNLAEGGLFMVEEPEIHLHPRAQAHLGDFFLELHKRSIQSIVETHSEHLILRLQQHVAARKINPNDIIFHYVYANEDGKAVATLRLSDEGKFIDPWPEGFFPERLEEAKKLSQIRDEYHG